MAAGSYVNIGAGNGLLPDGTKQLPEQCWLIIIEVQWHSCWGNFTRDASIINHYNLFENYMSKISLKFPMDQRVNGFTNTPVKNWYNVQQIIGRSFVTTHHWTWNPENSLDQFDTIITFKLHAVQYDNTTTTTDSILKSMILQEKYVVVQTALHFIPGQLIHNQSSLTLV